MGRMPLVTCLSTGLQAGRPTLENPHAPSRTALPPASSCTAGIARATWPAWADTARKRQGAALLALPAGRRRARTAETTLRAVMHSPLRLTDPHATTAYITAWHGYMIYDTLIAVDGDNR